MDGKKRGIDNVFVERLWRSVKYESIYLHACGQGGGDSKGEHLAAVEIQDGHQVGKAWAMGRYITSVAQT
jgi:hypothetical protein